MTWPTQPTFQNPYGGPMRNAWPGWGYGGMPGRYQAQPLYAPGQGFPSGYFGGSAFGYSGGDNPYGPGSYSSPGSMPFGGGSGMTGPPGGMTFMSQGVGNTQEFAPFQGFGQVPSQIQPLQTIRPYLDYRSPYGAGSAMRY